MNLLKEVVNGNLIVTGKGGVDKPLQWVTLVFNEESGELIDVEYYETEDKAKAGHEEAVAYYSKEKKG